MDGSNNGTGVVEGTTVPRFEKSHSSPSASMGYEKIQLGFGMVLLLVAVALSTLLIEFAYSLISSALVGIFNSHPLGRYR